MSNKILVAAALAILLSAGTATAATTYNYIGVIDACDAGICGLAGVASGDAVTGSMVLELQPDGSYDLATDLITFGFVVGIIPVLPEPGFDPGLPDDGPECTADPTLDGCGDTFFVTLSGTGTTGLDGNIDSGLIDGVFTGGTLGGLGGAFVFDPVAGSFAVSVFGSTVITVVGDLTVAPVPVPAAVWLMGSGLLGLAGMRRRRKA